MLLPYPYPPRLRAFLLFLSLSLTAASLFLSNSTTLDVCILRRELNEKPSSSSLLFFLPSIPIRDSPLHSLTVFLIWACALTLSLAPTVAVKSRSAPTRAARLHAVMFAAVWFHTTYILLAAGKAVLADFNCAGRHVLYPNGISGHYCYFVFCVLGLPCLAYMHTSSSSSRDIPENNNNNSQTNPSSSSSPSSTATTVRVVVLLLQSLVLSGSFATLYRTFFHGYHSLRQVFLGVALGLFSHLALDAVHFRADPARFAPHKLALLAANSLTAAALYIRLWPVEQAGQAITQMHVLFHVGAWAAVVVTGMAMQRSGGGVGGGKKTAMD